MCLRIKYISFLSVLLFLREGARSSIKKKKEHLTGHPMATRQYGILGQVRFPHSTLSFTSLLHCLHLSPPPAFILMYSFYRNFLGPGLTSTHTRSSISPFFTEIKHHFHIIPTIPNNKNIEVNLKTQKKIKKSKK